MMIPVDVEYYPHFPSKIGKTFVRTDVEPELAKSKGMTVCELAIQICEDGDLETTGNAKISQTGIYAPSVRSCEYQGNCLTIDFGQPCGELSSCELRRVLK